jgi:hypothetical protein
MVPTIPVNGVTMTVPSFSKLFTVISGKTANTRDRRTTTKGSECTDCQAGAHPLLPTSDLPLELFANLNKFAGLACLLRRQVICIDGA